MILSKRCRMFLVDWTIIVATSAPIAFIFYWWNTQPVEPVKFVSARLERDVIKPGESITVVAKSIRTESCPALINDFIVQIKDDGNPATPDAVRAVWRHVEIAGGYTSPDGKLKTVRFTINPGIKESGVYEFRSVRADLCASGVTSPKFPVLRFTVEE